MKILFRLLTLIIAISFCATPSSARKKKANITEPLFLFGVAIGLTDSTVYITRISVIDSASVKRLSKTLDKWGEYSAQLENYLIENEGIGGQICSTFYEDSRKEIEKKYISVRNRLIRTYGRARIIDISEEQFAYTYPEEDTDFSWAITNDTPIPASSQAPPAAGNERPGMPPTTGTPPQQ